ncbi:MAG: Flp family type IVb pilin [Massilia sp.]
MSKIITAVKSFVADENGVTAIEYGLIAALVGVAIVTTVTALGGQLKTTFNEVIVAMGGKAV